MRCVRSSILMAMTLSAVACSSISVSSDYDVTVDFAKLETYDWEPKAEGTSNDPRLDNPILNNSLLAGRLHRAVDYELSQRGFRKDMDGSPDFWVTYRVGMDRKLDVTTVQRYPGYYGGYRNWGGYSETHIREYDEGTLLIDVIAPATGTLIWRGTAQSRVNEGATPEERTAKIDKVVAAVLAKFPPAP